ncbi:hypothetical protein PR048_028829 [Dryococelus australis]|uniref:Uncharacterized protein n=1 Tax=Dryococelus australis TaxID=614101 RepID=A0ABQ9GBN2_9NEOP|nr:hypothetical protein PR048_028829 [Dryococelus australis]
MLQSQSHVRSCFISPQQTPAPTFRQVPQRLAQTVACFLNADSDLVERAYTFLLRHLRIFACENRAGRCRWSVGFLTDLPFPPRLHSGAAPYSSRFTLKGSQDLGVKSRPNLFTRSLSIPPTRTYSVQMGETLRTTQARASHASSSSAGIKRRGKREIPEETRRPTTSSGTIPTCENPVTRPGIEPGSPWWEAGKPLKMLLVTSMDNRAVSIFYPLQRPSVSIALLKEEGAQQGHDIEQRQKTEYREYPDTTHWPTATPSTFPTHENPDMTPVCRGARRIYRFHALYHHKMEQSSYCTYVAARSMPALVNYRCIVPRHCYVRWNVLYRNYFRRTPHNAAIGETVPALTFPSSSPTKATRVQSPAGSPDFCKWESCRTMPLIGRFSWGNHVSPALHSCSAPYSLQSPHRLSRPRCEPGSIPGRVTPGFSQVQIMPDAAAGPLTAMAGAPQVPRQERPWGARESELGAKMCQRPCVAGQGAEFLRPIMCPSFSGPSLPEFLNSPVLRRCGSGGTRQLADDFRNPHLEHAECGRHLKLGSPLVDDRPIMKAVKYRVVSGVVWTSRTMVSSNTDANRTGVLAVVDTDGDSRYGTACLTPYVRIPVQNIPFGCLRVERDVLVLSRYLKNSRIRRSWEPMRGEARRESSSAVMPGWEGGEIPEEACRPAIWPARNSGSDPQLVNGESALAATPPRPPLFFPSAGAHGTEVAWSVDEPPGRNEEIWATLNSEFLRTDEGNGIMKVNMERYRNEGSGGTGDPRENPPIMSYSNWIHVETQNNRINSARTLFTCLTGLEQCRLIQALSVLFYKIVKRAFEAFCVMDPAAGLFHQQVQHKPSSAQHTPYFTPLKIGVFSLHANSPSISACMKRGGRYG